MALRARCETRPTQRILTCIFVGGDYRVTPELDVAAGFYGKRLMQRAHVAVGNQLEYSLLIDYSLCDRTDVYLKYMFSNLMVRSLSAMSRRTMSRQQVSARSFDFPVRKMPCSARAVPLAASSIN
jgi:hypothetical protein